MKRIFVAMSLVLAILLAACGTSAHANGSTATTPCAPYPNGSGPYVYVAIGASDAVGFGATCPERDGYVPLLGQRMPHGADVVNLGIGGATVATALTDELSYAIAAHPNVITVWLAANDFRTMENGTLTLATYSSQLNQLLGALRTQTHADVYVANLPNLTELPIFQHGSVPLATVAQQNAAWNAAIDADVAQNHMFLVDLSTNDIAAHPQDIFIDGFHPTSAGYKLLADTFWQVMQAHGDPHA